jgi:hypothetical protein
MIRPVKEKRSQKKSKLWNDPYMPMPELLKEVADERELKVQKII